MPITIYVSKNGLASCPSCLNHIHLDDDFDETVCPFCEEKLSIAARTSDGKGAFNLLRNSRSGLLAGALATAGLSLAVGCGEPDPDPEPKENDPNWSPTEQSDAGGEGDDTLNYEQNPHEEYIADYGGFPDDYNYNYEPNYQDPMVDVGVGDDGDVDDDDAGDTGGD